MGGTDLIDDILTFESVAISFSSCKETMEKEKTVLREGKEDGGGDK